MRVRVCVCEREYVYAIMCEHGHSYARDVGV